jgi:glutathione peroxidase-family protein
MEIKVSIVIMSHLSDVQDGISLGGTINPQAEFNVKHKLNFVKFLIQRYPNTLDKINPDKEYEDFKKKHPNL